MVVEHIKSIKYSNLYVVNFDENQIVHHFKLITKCITICLVYITCNIILTEQIPHYIDNNNIDRNNECMIFFNLQKLILKNQALCI